MTSGEVYFSTHRASLWFAESADRFTENLYGGVSLLTIQNLVSFEGEPNRYVPFNIISL